jgi:phosphoglucosamine mutase
MAGADGVTTTAKRSLFGTDGVRGVANRELTPELALAIGRALGGRLAPGARVLVGRDTRLSGPMLEGALAAGLSGAGVAAVLVGVLPTPAVAELVACGDAAAGIVISASHNPFPDNGIKVFGGDGFKLPDAEEAAI